MNEIISTREMAQLCGVNESTVKRWADSGKIRCVKTPGGHRKFRMHEVLAFLREYGFDNLAHRNSPSDDHSEAPVSLRILNRDWKSLSGHYLETALTGCDKRTVQFLYQLATGGCSIVEMCDLVVAPALLTLGDRWEKGDLTVLQEHLAAEATHAALERLRDTLPRTNGSRPTALCCPVEGEAHSVGARMIAILLQQLGWQVQLTLSHVPWKELPGWIRREKPRLVCLSAIEVPIDDRFYEQARLVHQATREVGGALAIGGRRTAGHSQLPADLVASSLADLDRFVRSTGARRRG